MLFIDHYQQRQERNWWRQLSAILGVYWDLTASPPSEEAPVAAKEIMIPLSVAVNPKILEYVQKLRGTGSSSLPQGYTPVPGEQVVSTEELSKDQFLALLGRKPASKKSKKDK